MKTPETVATAGTPAERLELERVLASRSFAKSPRLCSLLAFIVNESLNGHHENLTEQQIGIHIFGRVPGYNSSEDTIVRVTVRQLRQRLDLYYSSEGSGNDLRIDIPKGGYVAVLERNASGPVPEPPVPVVSYTVAPELRPVAQVEGAPPASPVSHLRWRTSWTIIALLSLALLALAAVCLQQYRVLARRTAGIGPMPLWQAVFTPDRKTLIVPGDAALDNFIVWEQRSVNLEEYATQDYQRHAVATVPPTHKDVPISIRSVTPMADLAFVAMLTRAADHVRDVIPETGRVELRYARDVAVADTHDNNLVLIGADTFNPWVTLYQPQMDFVEHYDYVRDMYILQNKAPKSGEQAQYIYTRSQPLQKEYTEIALLNNSQGVGRVLIVQGTTMGSTYGALNFLTHDSLYQPVLRAATDGSGHLHDFEVVLSGNFLHGGVGNTRVVALHVH